MDITTIKNFFNVNIRPLLNLTSLWIKAKEALKLPYAKTYIVFSVFMLAIFLFITFPYDMLIRKKMKDLEKTAFRSLNVNELNFSVIDVIEMNGRCLCQESMMRTRRDNVNGDEDDEEE